MSWAPEQSEKTAIVKAEGRPNEPAVPHEQTRWERFKAFIWPFARSGGEWAKHGCELGRAYAEAEVDKKEAEVEKLAAEAADLAAATDAKCAETVTVVNDEIERIFTESATSEEARMLQLANLLASNPQIADQIERVGEILSRLALTRGVSFEIKAPPALPPGQTDDQAAE